MQNIDFMQYPYLVLGFVVLIVFMLILDLWVFNKKAHIVSNKEAVFYTVLWVSLAMIFSGIIYWQFWIEKFSEFQSAYWIEKSLSVDNLFVFILVFWFFKIPKEYQHKALFYWIIWAIILRWIFIFAWIWLINSTNINTTLFGFYKEPIHLNPIMIIFWVFLLFAWIKSFKSSEHNDEENDLKNWFIYRNIKKFLKTTDEFDGEKFFTVKNGVKYATPLFIAILMIELTDLVFAIDSIPAIFSVSQDTFILYTSNIFAVLGLRSLYFLLANSMWIFSKLHYWLAVILSFIWIKMLISHWFHIETKYSLAIIASVLIWTMIWSILANKKNI